MKTLLIYIAATVILLPACKKTGKSNEGSPSDVSTNQDNGTTESNGTDGSVTAEKNSISSDDEIYVEEGVELATDVTGAYLTLEPGVERAGNPISVFPANPSTQILTSITVKVPLESDNKAAALTQPLRELGVFYKIRKPDGTIVIGVQPVSPEQVSGNEITFKTSFFGTFQAGFLKQTLTSAVEKAVSDQIFTAKDSQSATFSWTTVNTTGASVEIIYKAEYQSASPVNYCLVRITKNAASGEVVLKTSTVLPEYRFKADEQTTLYFASFKCRTQSGLETPEIASEGGTLVPPGAPEALAFTQSITEDALSTLTLPVASDSSKPDGCSIGASENLLPVTCSCSAGICTAQVQGIFNFNGAAYFDFTLSKSGAASEVKRANLTVTPVDDAPHALDSGLGSVALNGSEVVSLPYTDPEGHLATACEVSALQKATEIPSCLCVAGACSAQIQFNEVGAGSFKFLVVANGTQSNLGTVTFDIQSGSISSLNLISLDFTNPSASATDLRSHIKLSGNANAADYDFYLIAEPQDETASVVSYTGDAAGSKEGSNGTKLETPVYIKGTANAPLDYFKFGLRHKVSQAWIANASPANPAVAHICEPSAVNSWSELQVEAGGPYLVCSIAQMLDIVTNCNTTSLACDKSFRQIADLNFASSGSSWDGGIAWGPVFTGRFNGGGHTISMYKPALTTYGSAHTDGGLFGKIGSGATLENIHLDDAALDFYTPYVSATNFGLLVGNASGTGISVKNIKITSSMLRLNNNSSHLGGLIGRAGAGVTVSNINIQGLTIQLPGGISSSYFGPVFGTAELGASFSRAAVDAASAATFASVASSPIIMGGLGGQMLSGASLTDSYSRMSINQSGSDSMTIGKILGAVDGAATSIMRVYADTPIADPSGQSIGYLAGQKISTSPNFLNLHVRSDGYSGEMYTFGNEATFLPGLNTYNPGNMNNAEFANWDFEKIWQVHTDRPPSLRP